MSAIRRFSYLIILILLPLILIVIWFRSGLIVGGGEEGLAYYNPTRTLELSKTMWWDYDGGFPTLAWLAKITSVFPTVFLYEKLNFPNYLLQAGTFFILLVVGGSSVYFLTLNLLEKFSIRKTVALVAAIFYILNPFSMSQIWARGLGSQYFSFALLPLAVLLFLKGLNGKILYLFYLTFASIIFSSAFGISTFVITYWVVLSATYVYWIFLNRRLTKKILYGSFFYILSLILWFVTQAWWFLPTVVSGNQIYFGYLENYQENIGTLLGVSRNYTPEVIIRLLQRTYFFDPSAFSPIYSSFTFQLISLLIPIFLVIGLIVIFKRKELGEFKFFVLLFILGLLVSLGANPPLGWLFVFIFNHFPFLQSFRNPYEKFGLVYALGYTPIFTLGVVYFFEQKVKWLKFLGLAAILFFICGIYAWPMWTGRVVAGPDKKVGIPVPSYYKDLQKWLSNNGENYRVFMTPLWIGDGAFYDWSGTRYQGLDPTIYILNTPTVSSSPRYPYYYDFMQNIRRYKERINLAPSLALLRTKYLVNRQDAIMLTDSEKLHSKFFTEAIYPPLGRDFTKESICQNQRANSKPSGTAWLICKISDKEGEWSKVKYLHLTVKTDSPADLEIAVRDKREMRIRWDGRTASEYRTDSSDWTEVTIPLSAPTEYNADIDFSKISLVEVLAHPKNSPQGSVGEILLRDIKPDSGKEEKTNEFSLVNTFGKLQVYEPLRFNAPPEFGSLLSVSAVSDFPQLFEEVRKKRDSLDKNGFVLISQNAQKNLQDLPWDTLSQVIDKHRISNTKFWLKTNEASGPALVILSQNYNPQWKVIAGVSREKLAGNFFDDINLLKAVVLPEDNHFVVNGYANLWKVDRGGEYVIVFLPQVIVDIASKISIFSVILLVGGLSVWLVKKYTFSH